MSAICKILSSQATKEKAQGSIKDLHRERSCRELNLEMGFAGLCLGTELK